MAFSFVTLLVLVKIGMVDGIDRTIAIQFRDPATRDLLGPLWFQEAARDVTSLGSLSVMAIVLLIALSQLWAAGLPRCAALLAASVLSGQVFCYGLKIPVARPRPSLTADAPPVFTASFPSAHALTSMLVFLLLALIIGALSQRLAVRGCTAAAAAILIGLIGCSRLYLGVHWASDILAGWLAGATWALASWQIGRRFCGRELHEQRRSIGSTRAA